MVCGRCRLYWHFLDFRPGLRKFTGPCRRADRYSGQPLRSRRLGHIGQAAIIRNPAAEEAANERTMVASIIRLTGKRPSRSEAILQVAVLMEAYTRV